MIRSFPKKHHFVASLLVFALFSFKSPFDITQMLNWGNRCLMQYYDVSAEDKLKKFELNITPDYFLRLRKTFTNGKQEYFSCHLRNFEELNYLGTTTGGLLKISTKPDHIIVQTYNDRKGNIDTMATVLNIPVRNMEAEQIDSLRQVMVALRNGQGN